MNPVALACTALGHATVGTMRSIGTGEAAAAADALRAMALRDWAVRVLDAWATRLELLVTPHPFRVTLDGPYLIHGIPGVTGADPDAVRLAAAQAIWPMLQKTVRADLGEKP